MRTSYSEAKTCYLSTTVKPGTIETNTKADGTPFTIKYGNFTVLLTAHKIPSFATEKYRIHPIDLPIGRPFPDTIEIKLMEDHPDEADFDS